MNTTSSRENRKTELATILNTQLIAAEYLRLLQQRYSFREIVLELRTQSSAK